MIGQNDFTEKLSNLLILIYGYKIFNKKLQFIYEDDIIRLINIIIKDHTKIIRQTYNVANKSIKISLLKKLVNLKSKNNVSTKLAFHMINNLIDNKLIQNEYNFKFTNTIKVIKKLKKFLNANYKFNLMYIFIYIIKHNIE